MKILEVLWNPQNHTSMSATRPEFIRGARQSTPSAAEMVAGTLGEFSRNLRCCHHILLVILSRKFAQSAALAVNTAGCSSLTTVAWDVAAAALTRLIMTSSLIRDRNCFPASRDPGGGK